MSAIRILVTAFGAFPGARTNPTLAVLARLAASRRHALRGIDVRPHALPVVYANAREHLAALVERTRPDAILHLGLAGRRTTLSVETRAINRLHPLRPDAARRVPASTAVVAGGAPVLRSRWPSQRLAVAMRQAGAPTRLSIDAGDYVCNQQLYLTLATTSVLAGFVHVPRPRARDRRTRDRRARGPRPSVQEMATAIDAALQVLAIATMAARRRSPAKKDGA